MMSSAVNGLKGKKLFNGENIIEDFLLLWHGEKIMYCGPEKECPAKPGSAFIRDVSGCFVMPGMFNCHVHMLRSGEVDKDMESGAMAFQKALNGIKNAEMLLENGVIWARDCGSPGDMIFELRDSISSGDVAGADIKVAGEALSVTGGHGGDDSCICDGREQFVYGVRRQVGNGCDHIKIMVTGSFSDKGEELCPMQMTYEEISAAVETAHRHGRRVAAHAHGVSGIKACIECGVDSIEHGTLMTPEIAQLLGDNKRYLVSTLSAPYFVTYPGTDEQRADPRYQHTLEIVDHHMGTVLEAFEAGAVICLGSDCGTSHVPFSSCLTELVLMSRSGLPNIEVLRAATINSARLLEVEKDYGTLEAGKTASFVVLEKDPLTDMENILSDKDVYKKGERVFSGIRE